eukprot:gene3598-3863_t
MADPGDRLAEMQELNEEEEDEEEQHQADQADGDDPHHAGRRRVRERGIPLENLFRLLAGQRVVIERRQAAGTNEELVAGLKRTGMLTR